MSGMEGYEVCKHLQASEKNKKPDIIAITGYYSEDTEKKILDCGARVCLPKPVNFERLIQEIEVTAPAIYS